MTRPGSAPASDPTPAPPDAHLAAPSQRRLPDAAASPSGGSERPARTRSAEDGSPAQPAADRDPSRLRTVHARDGGASSQHHAGTDGPCPSDSNTGTPLEGEIDSSSFSAFDSRETAPGATTSMTATMTTATTTTTRVEDNSQAVTSAVTSATTGTTGTGTSMAHAAIPRASTTTQPSSSHPQQPTVIEQPAAPTYPSDAPPVIPHAATLLTLLRCPLCLFSRASSAATVNAPGADLLDAPVTLRCGHTVCRTHLASGSSSAGAGPAAAGRCPIPTCRRDAARAGEHGGGIVGVHPEARVGFVPAPMAPRAREATGAGDEERRTDVTVGKVMALVRRAAEAEAEAQAQERVRVEDEEGTEEEGSESDRGGEDGDRHGGASSLHRSHSLSRLRPRKRRRVMPDAASGRRSHRPGDGTLGEHERRGAFAKELLSELTCEICFALLWQPVTTPCQHVSVSIGSFVCFFFLRCFCLSLSLSLCPPPTLSPPPLTVVPRHACPRAAVDRLLCA
jgi:hypothetical protein